MFRTDLGQMLLLRAAVVSGHCRACDLCGPTYAQRQAPIFWAVDAVFATRPEREQAL